MRKNGRRTSVFASFEGRGMEVGGGEAQVASEGQAADSEVIGATGEDITKLG